MKSHNKVTCPACKTEFSLEDVFTEDLEKNIRKDYEKKNQEFMEQFKSRSEALENQIQSFEEKKKKENQLFTERLQQEILKISAQKEEEIFLKVSNDHKTKLDFLETQNKENHEKIKLLNEKEFEVLQLKRQLENQKEQEEFNLRKWKLKLKSKKCLLKKFLLKKEISMTSKNAN